MRGTTSLCLLMAACALVGCRSPFGSAPEDPEAGRVGRGVHGWPLYESAPHGPGWRTDIAWPGYSSIKTEGEGLDSTMLLIPIFLFESEGERRRVGFLRPIWDLETKGDDVYDLDLLWPLIKWKDTPGTSERRVVPLYFAKDDDGVGYQHLWPFYGREWSGTREQQWVLAPLFSHTSDPDRGLSTWDAPWPLVQFGRDGDERHVRFLPLLWHEEDSDETHTVVFPFIWDFETPDNSFRMVFPLFVDYEASDGDHARSLLPPLYIRGRDDREEYTWLVAPLVRWGETEDAWSAHAFPFLWLARADNGDSLTHVWPLFGWEQDGDERKASVAWPFLRHGWDDEGWETDLPWPLIHLERRPDYSDTRVWPLFGWEEDGEEREASIAWPFLRHEWNEDGWETDLPWPLIHLEQRPGRSETRVWPLFRDEQHISTKDGEEVHHREGDVLFYLSNWESHGGDEHDFRILWKVLRSSREAEKDTFVLNPLFRHESNDQGDSYWSFLFGLIARKQEQGEVDWRFLWFL